MELHARAPDPLTNQGNMANNWHSWKEDFIIFMKVTGYVDKPNEVRANLLKNRIGKIGIDAIQNMSFKKPEDKDDMDILLIKLEQYFNPPKKEVVERFHYFTTKKKPNESIEQHINNLREKAKTCNFKEMTESLILDKVILDIPDKILRKKLFEVDDLDLQKLVAIYNDYSTNIEKMKQVTQENKTEATTTQFGYLGTSKQKLTGSAENQQAMPKGGGCWRCGHSHPLGKCPAFGSKCTKCGEINHFTQCCRGKSNFNQMANESKVNKNILNPNQPPKKMMPKSNEKLRNNPADSAVTIAITDSISEMTLPDIPTNSIFGDSASCDAPFDLVLHVLDTCSTSPSLNRNITASPSTELPNTSQYNYTNMSEVKPDWTLDLHKKDTRSKPKATHADTFNKWKEISTNTSTENISYNDCNMESDTGYSTLGATNTLQRIQYSPFVIFVLTMSHTLRQVLKRQADRTYRHLGTIINMFVNIVFCRCISRYRDRQCSSP